MVGGWWWMMDDWLISIGHTAGGNSTFRRPDISNVSKDLKETKT
jgi:hypothetical protein